MFTVPASSRASLLPQVLAVLEICKICGSGFTREEAGTG
jgi:hypothetical protein